MASAKPSIAHLNNLFAIETEYANFSRNLANGYESALGTNRNICDFIQQAVGIHDHGSISKKMNFKPRLPKSFAKWTQ
ncbi:hypothetical protein SCHPADRAFT_899547 [Schizopora paradoxa]|uniref:Uncharacterized protein n=1 Tax=Schizopora paradoxa TaxID=27342 RepID=A0A0H2SA05_9AGAM|nr:hypothetical protein SCHPADRAFT_899547 [Schizopora paradoxa]